MKRHYTPALVAVALLFAACGESRKDQIKKRLVEKCMTQASSAQRAPDAQLQRFIKEYCNCTVDKFGANLSESQLDSLDQVKGPGNAEMMERLAPLVDECTTTIQEKIRSAGADR